MAGAASHRQGTGGGAPRRQPAAGDAAGLAIEGLALARGMRVIQPSLTHRMAAGEITLTSKNKTSTRKGVSGASGSKLLRKFKFDPAQPMAPRSRHRGHMMMET